MYEDNQRHILKLTLNYVQELPSFEQAIIIIERVKLALRPALQRIDFLNSLKIQLLLSIFPYYSSKNLL